MSVIASTWTELAARAIDGLEVTLLWSRSSGRVKVAVDDLRLGHRIAFDVKPGDALAAFHHPFAYTPRRAIRRRRVDEFSTDLQLQH
jgi:hypothetical protein